jgi:hypothetical protein
MALSKVILFRPDWFSIVRGRRPRLQEQNHVQGLFKLESGRGEAGFDIVPVMSIPDPIAQKFHRNPVLLSAIQACSYNFSSVLQPRCHLI